MEVKTYLGLVDRYDRAVQYKINELYKLKAMSTSISASFSDDVRVQTSMGGGRLESAVLKVIDLENEINELVDRYIDCRQKIIKQIETIEDTNMYAVLVERYIERKPFDEICVSMGYSRRQINRIHGEALALFANRFADDMKDFK